jgi:hypothetical protein
LGRNSGLGLRFAWHLAVAVLIGMGIFVLWALPANNATDGEFLRQGIGKHVLARIGLGSLAERCGIDPGVKLSGGMEGHNGPFYFYVPILLATFFPWVALLPLAFWRLIRGHCQPRSLAVLVLAWFLPTFVIISLASTKLSHYILPVFPALAIAVGAVIAAPRSGLTSDRRALHIGWFLAAATLIVGALAVIIAPMIPWALWWPSKAIFIPGLIAPFTALGLTLIAFVVIARRAISLKRLPLFAAHCATGMLVLCLVFVAFVAPVVETTKPSKPIAQAILRATVPQVPVSIAITDRKISYDEPSLYFHLNRTPIERLVGQQEIQGWFERPGPGVLILTAPILSEIKAKLHRPGLSEIVRCSGFNGSSGQPVEVIALGRNLAR